MNFLAHAFLSFGHPEILIGNLITDFIRGIHKKTFSPGIQTGITLHHAIDAFTDRHPVTIAAREYLHPACGRYSGVFMDVIYDYFLANDENQFSLTELQAFSKQTYRVLTEHAAILPVRFSRIFHYMKKEDWLFHYHTKAGINNAFHGIYRRADYLEESSAAYLAFNTHYDKLQEAYVRFMPEVTSYAKRFIEENT